MMQRRIHSLSIFMRCRTGASALEFALVFPLFLMIFVGLVEVGRFLYLQQKVDTIASAMADFASQTDNLTRADLNSYASASNQLMRPFQFSGSIIFTYVFNYQANPQPPCGVNTPCVVWQYEPIGPNGSKIGTTGNNPVLPNNYHVPTAQGVVVAEAFYFYQPLFPIPLITTGIGSFGPFFSPETLYSIAISKTRDVPTLTLG